MRILLTAIGTILPFAIVAGGDEIEEMHNKLPWAERVAKSSTLARANARMASGITEIGLERGYCYGTCPVYTVFIDGNGSFRYKGIAFVQRLGKYTGRIRPWDFHRLCGYIREIGFMKLDSTYSDSVTDQADVYTTVVIGKKRKVVRDYGSSGPATLWALEQLIDRCLEKAEWQPAKKSQIPKPGSSN